jgi:hypothetical protein
MRPRRTDKPRPGETQTAEAVYYKPVRELSVKLPACWPRSAGAEACLHAKGRTSRKHGGRSTWNLVALGNSAET